MNHASKLALFGLSLLLAACSALETDKVDYKVASKAPDLVVPPDLTQLSRDTRYAIPGAPVTASGYQQAAQAGAALGTAVKSVSDVRLERAGTQRWLVVDRPADKLWDEVVDFWKEHGFTMPINQPQLGIMETEWAENRAKLPQDFLRRTLGKALSTLYDTGERDKFRTRLERNAAGGTDIFISHRGMVEVYTETYSTEGNNPTRWQPRPNDPELEAEFLQRLMVKLGVAQEVAKQQLAPEAKKQTSRVVTVDGRPVVQVEEGFDRTWRRVGLALDRTGFTVEDRDRSQGLYFVRYVEPVNKEEEPGFFRRLFGAKAKESAPQKFRIAVKGEGVAASTVSVLNAEGQPETSDIAQRIVKVLADELK